MCGLEWMKGCVLIQGTPTILTDGRMIFIWWALHLALNKLILWPKSIPQPRYQHSLLQAVLNWTINCYSLASTLSRAQSSLWHCFLRLTIGLRFLKRAAHSFKLLYTQAIHGFLASTASLSHYLLRLSFFSLLLEDSIDNVLHSQISLHTAKLWVSS